MLKPPFDHILIINDDLEPSVPVLHLTKNNNLLIISNADVELSFANADKVPVDEQTFSIPAGQVRFFKVKELKSKTECKYTISMKKILKGKVKRKVNEAEMIVD
jgi:hypothetical protein